MSKVVFCSFGDKRLRPSLRRLERQAKAISVYSHIYIFTEDELDKKFSQKYSEILIPGSRGFGYWVWKPQVVKQVFDKLDDGDVLHYADIGCWINASGRRRLEEYIKIVQRGETGILGFRIPNEKPDSKLNNFSYPEYVWTKGDLFDYFGVKDRTLYTHTEQFVTTSFFLRKSKTTIAFLDEWARIWDISAGLIDDSPSVSNNFDGFIEHRHDQSAFSLLAKKYTADSLSYLELEYPVLIYGNNYLDGKSYYLDWDKLKDFPIQARRDKNPGFSKKIYIRAYNKLIKLLFSGHRNNFKIWGLR